MSVEDPALKAKFDFTPPAPLVQPVACRNCSKIWSLSETSWVDPGYRFCAPCYGQMVLIGQVVEDWRKKDGTMIMLWQGDPFNRTTRDPTRHMFGRGKHSPYTVD